ncbi:MAG: 4Fe-4S dicluster domain-containing protein [Deltaproteobacteria bacterium]|nr:4Fe-4S dicluster domain-containing protein [Deltaproteobacteria bacterium]
MESILRKTAKELLEGKKVDVVVGYTQGSVPLTMSPVFITNPDDAERLVFNALCSQNLAKYVHDVISQNRAAQKRLKPEERKKKVVGVVARGCTTRSLVLNLQEKQYTRDEIFIIGVPCAGYVDQKKLSAAVGGTEILDGSLTGGKVTVKTPAGEKSLVLAELLADNCLVCAYNNPIISDITIGEPAKPMNSANEFKKVEDFAALPLEERWSYFAKEMEKCIRCCACRNICPSCYCPECFAEQSMPQWVGVGADATDTQVFQLMRLFHMAGRCVDCGSCVSVCPMGVDLRMFLKKLDKDALDLFDARTGINEKDLPAFSVFKEREKNEEFLFEP